MEFGGFLSLLNKSFIIVIISAEFNTFTLSAKFWFADPIITFEVFISLNKMFTGFFIMVFIFLNLNLRINKIRSKKIRVSREHLPKERQDGLVSKNEFPSRFNRINIF